MVYQNVLKFQYLTIEKMKNVLPLVIENLMRSNINKENKDK